MSDSPSARPAVAFFLVFALAAVPLRDSGPAAVLWTAPGILLASMLIAWGAESAQFFIAQGFALAILAWMQTLPEFAVEAVLAWKQQVHFLLANLTGALRLLTGVGWPMIYFAAAAVHRRRTGKPLDKIVLDASHGVQVVGLLVPLLYAVVIWWKGTLHPFDSLVLVGIYASYLVILAKMPPEARRRHRRSRPIPRFIVTSHRRRRVALIALCFLAGGTLIYLTAEPFLASLIGLAAFVGIPTFVFIQWVAPVVSEFPELASTFYFARTVTGAPMALMNMVSSNINQWTLLPAMLAIVFSTSAGHIAGISFDGEQRLELLMTIAQAATGMVFLLNMELTWWEALSLFVLWFFQFALSLLHPSGSGAWPAFVQHSREYVTGAYLVYAAAGVVVLLARRKTPAALAGFALTWRSHVRRSPPAMLS